MRSYVKQVREGKQLSLLTSAMVIILAVCCFFLGIQLMGAAFTVIGQDVLSYMNEGTSNPFVGLFIGILVTAILQSSSTTTSVAVAAVASGSLDLGHAIPIVMGANLGTTITSTIVAFGYISRRNDFRKAIAAATLHDLFNIMGILILFPLELNWQVLQRLSLTMASVFPTGTGSADWGGFTGWFSSLCDPIVVTLGPLLAMVLSFILLFGTIKQLAVLLYVRLVGKHRKRIQNTFFSNRFRTFGWGLLLTSIVQSSSLTSSLIVPLVASGKVRIHRAFQFLMGANLGTTITALIAAMFRSEEAISLALAHFMFNFISVMLFSLLPFLGNLTVYLSEWLGELSQRYRLTSFAYITLTFFIIPFTLIYFSDRKGDYQTKARVATEILSSKSP